MLELSYFYKMLVWFMELWLERKRTGFACRIGWFIKYLLSRHAGSATRLRWGDN